MVVPQLRTPDHEGEPLMPYKMLGSEHLATTQRRPKIDNHPAFSPLFQTLREHVPVEFQLPADIRGHFRDGARSASS